MDKYSLIGVDGNAFCVMGYVVNAMKKEGKTEDEVKEYRKKAMSSNYDHLLCISFEMIDNLNMEAIENE